MKLKKYRNVEEDIGIALHYGIIINYSTVKQIGVIKIANIE